MHLNNLQSVELSCQPPVQPWPTEYVTLVLTWQVLLNMEHKLKWWYNVSYKLDSEHWNMAKHILKMDIICVMWTPWYLEIWPKSMGENPMTELEFHIHWTPE